uniref:RING-type domain-containing protein n=1 Tax=Glossina pallidipes TaxID=7398 RepID=A0A1B0ABR4_GLOPL
MELSPGAFCSICVECFTASDSIYSIACRHVYHAQCIEKWKSRSRNCPECRCPFNSMERVFLNVEDDSKIQSHANELKKLRDKLYESEKKLADMQIKHTISEEKVRELEKKFESVKKSEEALRKQIESKQKEDCDTPKTYMDVDEMYEDFVESLERYVEQLREAEEDYYENLEWQLLQLRLDNLEEY